MNISNNKILITGGASGIGLGLTERFIRENNTVIICGRREEALMEVSDKFPSVITKVCDLSEESERIQLYEWIAENHSDLNVLVNNAGIQNWMNISDQDFYEKANAEITINVLAPVHLTTLFTRLYSLNYHQCYFGSCIRTANESPCLLRNKGLPPFFHNFLTALIETKRHRSN